MSGNERPEWEPLTLLHQAIDALPGHFLVVDSEGRYRFLGGQGLPASRRGRTHEVIGRRFVDSPGVVEANRTALARALGGESFTLSGPNAGRMWEQTWYPLRDPQGNVNGACALTLDVSDRAGAESARRKTAALLHALVETLPFDVWATDEHDRIVLQNATSRRHWGDLSGRDARGVVRSTGLPVAAIRTAAQRVEWRREDEADARTLLLLTAPIEVDGHCSGIVGATLDVTDLEQARAALQRERDFSAAVIDTVGSLLVVLDGEGRIRRFNRAAQQFAGVSEADVLGRPYWEVMLVDPDPATAHARGVRFMETLPLQVESPIYAAAGVRYVAWTNRVLKRPDGVVDYLVCSGVDVTERRLAEEAKARVLAEEQLARRRSEFLVEATGALSATLDYEATLRTIAQLAVPDIADLCVVDLVEDGKARRVAVAATHDAAPELIEELRTYAPELSAPEAIPRVLRTGKPFLSRTIRRDVLEGGAEAWQRVGMRSPRHQQIVRELGLASLICVPLVTRQRSLGALTFLSRTPDRFGPDDVAFGLDLAARAALAVENARLYREARQAVAAREEFLSIAAHELRTPLTALQLCAQSLLRPGPAATPDPAYELQALETVEQQAKRLGRLVDMLLDVTRAQAGRLELALERVDLREVVEEVIEAFAEERKGRDVRLEVRGDVTGVWDRARLDQVVTNLFSNALKYSDSRPVSLLLDGSASGVRIDVRDEGPGIPVEKRARLFSRFERVGENRRISGLGLGLYIARCIVEAHGGSVRVEDVVPHGANFVVELPREAPGASDLTR